MDNKGPKATDSFEISSLTISASHTRRSSQPSQTFRQMVGETFLTMAEMNIGGNQFKSKKRRVDQQPTSPDTIRRNESMRRTSIGMNTSDSRMDLHNIGRDKVITQINEFANKYQGKLDDFAQGLTSKFKEMTVVDQGLQKQYIISVQEKNYKELVLETLVSELESLKDEYEIEKEMKALADERIIEEDDVKDDMSTAYSQESKNQILSEKDKFNVEDEKPEIEGEKAHEKTAQFLFSSYEYLLNILTRYCNMMTAVTEISKKEPGELHRKIDEISKFLIESKKVLSRVSKQQDEEDFSNSPIIKRKLAKIFKDKLDSWRTNDDAKLDADDDILKDLKDEQEKENEDTPIKAQLRRLAEFDIDRRTKQEVQNLFLHYFPNCLEESQEFSNLVTNDILLKHLAHNDMIDKFLSEQMKVQMQHRHPGKAALENIWTLKDQALDLQKHQFRFIFITLEELLLLALKEKSEKHSFVKERKKLTLASWIRDLELQKSDEQYSSELVRQSINNKIENLIKHQDYEAFEEKERIRREALMRREDEMTALLKKKKETIDDVLEIRERISDLAKDNKRKVWQTYAEFSRNKLPQVKAKKLKETLEAMKKAPDSHRSSENDSDAHIYKSKAIDHFLAKRQGVIMNGPSDDALEEEHMERVRIGIKFKEELLVMEKGEEEVRQKDKNSVIDRLMPKQRSIIKKMNEDTKIFNRISRLQKITSQSEFEKKVIDAVHIPNYITEAEIPGKYRVQTHNTSVGKDELPKIHEEVSMSRFSERSEGGLGEIFKNTIVPVSSQPRHKTPSPFPSDENSRSRRPLRRNNSQADMRATYHVFNDSSRDQSYRVLPPIERI